MPGLSQRARMVCLAGASLAVGAAMGIGLDRAWAAPRPQPAPSHHSRYQKLDVFSRALAIVEQYYVRPIDGEKLMHAALRGLVSELDPHTNFLAPDEARLLREDIEGEFGGVGMVVVLGRDADGKNYLDVRDVIPDAPAWKAGVKVGNRITKIAGKPIAQFSDLQQAIVEIRGASGTKIQVTIEDVEAGTQRTISLVRALIDPPAVEVRYLGEGIGVLRLRDFPDDAAKEIREGVVTLRKEAKAAGLHGAVLDLRDNGGGLLDEAIGIVDHFVAEGPIVRTRGRRGTLVDEARARRAGTEADLPLVVLVNKASASASEIVAGALQDHHRALIIGERTYGKGSVQAPFELDDGSLLKLTTALYYTPADRLIQASGITPDVFVGATKVEKAEKAIPRDDSRPEVIPERENPRHLEPEDFGRETPSMVDEGAALTAAGDDLQLRAAVQHLQAIETLASTRRDR
ncbi:MAG: S41 family peptidase [Myxococcota bacterium]